MKRRTTFGLMALVGAVTAFHGTGWGQGDPVIIEKIIQEGKENGQVWDHLLYLSEEIGPRLTTSSRLQEANEWTRDRFASFGLSNAHLVQWGEAPVRFDRGPSEARMVEPVEMEFEFTTPAWTAGTDGLVSGPVVKAPETMEELEAIRDQLDGAWILSKGLSGGRRRGVLREGDVPPVREQIEEELKAHEILGIIVASRNDLVTTGGRGWRDMDPNDLPAEVEMRVRRSDYDAMNSRLADGEEVIVEASLENNLVPGPFPLYNTIAEIPGTEKPDEVIIISAHLDSWDGPGSMGTQDNGTGSSVTLEAARLLMAAGAEPKRTIRFILWTGEEQGLLGSRAYVESLSEEEKAKISAVFVDDGGTNFQGGLQCVEEMAPMLREATAPVNEAFPEMQVAINVNERMSRGGGSDHASFNRAGIPGFFWDEEGRGGREGRNYRYVWHTQHDTPRYAVPEYLVQSAVCSAVTAYNLACAETLLPRYVPSDDEDEEEDVGRRGRFRGVDGPLNGTWAAQTINEDGSPGREFTLTFRHLPEDRIFGRSESELGGGRLSDITFDAETGKLTWKYEVEDYGTIEYQATVTENEMTGTLSMADAFSAQFKATRTADRDDDDDDDDGGGDDDGGDGST